MTEIAQHLAEMVRRRPPDDVGVVPGTTPVVSFGDVGRAEVATLGINPSRSEFLDRHGHELIGGHRRLATLRSLAATGLDELRDAQVAQVLADCAGYFHRQPYRRWFDPLDKLLRDGAAASYYDGTACHLDLVPWATDPTWSGLGSDVRRRLLEQEAGHLEALLANARVDLVVVNGRAVLSELGRTGLARLEPAGKLGRYTLVVGEGVGIRWVGWTVNLQSSHGVSTAIKEELAAWLSEHSHRTGPSRG